MDPLDVTTDRIRDRTIKRGEDWLTATYNVVALMTDRQAHIVLDGLREVNMATETFNLNAWLRDTYRERTFGKYKFAIPRPPLICADGFSMSVQAGRGMFCEPPIDDDVYTSVEVGYPNAPTPELEPYGDDDNVYARVPVTVVEAIVAAHGGLMQQEVGDE